MILITLITLAGIDLKFVETLTILKQRELYTWTPWVALSALNFRLCNYIIFFSLFLWLQFENLVMC